MNPTQRTALIGLCHAVLGVSGGDEFTRARAHRLLGRLTGNRFLGTIFA